MESPITQRKFPEFQFNIVNSKSNFIPLSLVKTEGQKFNNNNELIRIEKPVPNNPHLTISGGSSGGYGPAIPNKSTPAAPPHPPSPHSLFWRF